MLNLIANEISKTVYYLNNYQNFLFKEQFIFWNN